MSPIINVLKYAGYSFYARPAEFVPVLINTMIEKVEKQSWTFTLIGTDNLDVETMAHSFAIEVHMEFQQDMEGTKAMFARERRSSER